MNKALLTVLTCVAFPVSVHADDSILYRSSVIVTGDREETRVPVIPQGFERAAQKLTGNPDIAQNPLFASLATSSSGIVWSYTYHDRMFGIPIHDEQGTRDRPFDLTFQFDKKRMDEAMAKLGEKPWLGQRPKLALLIWVTNAGRNYVLAADGIHGTDMRESIEDASGRFAMPVIFASEANLAAAMIMTDKVAVTSNETLAALKLELGADAVLVGHLDWENKKAGWHGTWQLPLIAKSPSWEITGVNFDTAFRSAIGGAAKRLRR